MLFIGLYYYRARMYYPELGRFMQTDPIGYYDSMNMYAYCGNNPVNMIDPWGLDAYIIFEPSGPDFAPFLGHVDLGVDMPDGTVLVRGAAWGSLAPSITHNSLDDALNYEHQGTPMRRSYIRLKEKQSKKYGALTSDDLTRSYIEELGKYNEFAQWYCVPYVQEGIDSAEYGYLSGGFCPHDFWIKAKIAEKFTDNVEVVKGGERCEGKK